MYIYSKYTTLHIYMYIIMYIRYLYTLRRQFGKETKMFDFY